MVTVYHPNGNYSSIIESGNNQVELECIHGFPFPTLVASLRLKFAYILAIAYISCDLGSGAKFIFRLFSVPKPVVAKDEALLTWPQSDSFPEQTI